MILREMLKSKIHKAVITEKKIDYNGSIGVDKRLLDESGILPGEKVQVLNFNNGQRLDYFLITPDLSSKLKKVTVYPKIGFSSPMASDHAPIVMELRL